MTAPRSIDLGGVLVTLVSGGVNLVDGGGMMGILPKGLWNKWYNADEDNRIRLETNCLVVDTQERRLLIESGCGNRLGEKERRFYGGENSDWIGANLISAGFSLDSFDQVVLTHLHTDHSGGVVTLDDRGCEVPTFPNAQVIVSEQELQDATEGVGISPNAYDHRNWAVLEERGLLKSLPADAPIAPGVRFVASPGHTEGHQSVLLEGTHGALLFTGDLLPLYHHAVPHYNMAYDVNPVQKTEIKCQLLERSYREGWTLVLCHEPVSPVCRVVYREEKGRYELVGV